MVIAIVTVERDTSTVIDRELIELNLESHTNGHEY